jgi:hypothetical protein
MVHQMLGHCSIIDSIRLASVGAGPGHAAVPLPTGNAQREQQGGDSAGEGEKL